MQRIPNSTIRRLAPPDDAALIALGTDPASGLLTREALAEVLARRTAAEERFAGRFALLLVELDGVAAPLPPGVARRLRASVRGADLLARWNETALAVLMSDPSGAPDASGLAPRFAMLVRRAFGDEDEVTACRVGLAVFPTDAWDARALMDHAESALRAALPLAAAPPARRLAAAWPREAA